MGNYDRRFPTPFRHYRPRTHKVFGIICSTRDGKYLLVCGKKSGKWSFPKGHMESGETALECARRELYEESGITLPDDIGYVTVKPSRNRDGNNAEYFQYVVDVEIPVSINDNLEIGKGGWFTLPEIQLMDGNIDVTNFGSQKGFPPCRPRRINDLAIV